MTSRFRVSGTLPRKLRELGVAPADVLRQAGLPTRLFDQEKILVSTEELFALYRGIAEASKDPGFGLKLGNEERIERYDPIKIAALSARSFGDALHRMARYKQLICPEEIRLIERGNECAVQFVWLLAHEKERREVEDAVSDDLRSGASERESEQHRVREEHLARRKEP